MYNNYNYYCCFYYNYYNCFLSYRTDSMTLGLLNVFILLSGWICLHGVLD